MSYRERKKRQAKRQWIQAGKACFAREGFGGASVARIAAEAGLSRPGFFLYFPSKQALCTAIRLECLQALTMMASQEAEREGRDERLLHALDRMRQYLASEAEYLQAIGLFAAGLADGEPEETMAWLRLAEYLGRLTGQARTDEAHCCLAAGILRSGWQARTDSVLMANALAAVFDA